MRTLLTVARELAQCAHDQVELVECEGGVQRWLRVCRVCGARSAVLQRVGDPVTWTRPRLVDELAQLLEHEEDAHA